ncbi:MAG: Lrp/AsnC family transcriptional regulator [Roseburia sp.]|nr:Lrp/AsnC family transcriptional regulator [Roseburia sp.]
MGESAEFVEFMLGMICDALKEISDMRSGANVAINVGLNVVTNEEKIIALLTQDGKMSAYMLSISVGITERQTQRILAKLKDNGKIIRHGGMI